MAEDDAKIKFGFETKSFSKVLDDMVEAMKKLTHTGKLDHLSGQSLKLLVDTVIAQDPHIQAIIKKRIESQEQEKQRTLYRDALIKVVVDGKEIVLDGITSIEYSETNKRAKAKRNKPAKRFKR